MQQYQDMQAQAVQKKVMHEAKIYPTEARLKQKARLKEMKGTGIIPTKRIKDIEHGTDDCGDDISGLGKGYQDTGKRHS